jgi:hypothetical protein
MQITRSLPTSKVVVIAIISLVIAIFGVYIVCIHVDGYIGSFNPDGTTACAYDHEGFWSISFLNINGPKATPRAVKDVLYRENREFISEHTKTDVHYLHMSTEGYNVVFHPNAISCEVASSAPINGMYQSPVSFVADPFLFIIPQHVRSLGSVGFKAAGILDDLMRTGRSL